MLVSFEFCVSRQAFSACRIAQESVEKDERSRPQKGPSYRDDSRIHVEETVRGKQKRGVGCDLRLRLGGHALVERNGIKRAREAILHVLIEIHSVRGMRAIVVAAAGIRGRVVTAVAVGGNTRSGAEIVIDFRRGNRVSARVARRVLAALGGHAHWQRVGGSVVGRHDVLTGICEGAKRDVGEKRENGR